MHRLKEPRLIGKMFDIKVRQEKYKMSLGPFVVTEGKKCPHNNEDIWQGKET